MRPGNGQPERFRLRSSEYACKLCTPQLASVRALPYDKLLDRGLLRCFSVADGPAGEPLFIAPICDQSFCDQSAFPSQHSAARESHTAAQLLNQLQQLASLVYGALLQVFVDQQLPQLLQEPLNLLAQLFLQDSLCCLVQSSKPLCSCSMSYCAVVWAVLHSRSCIYLTC